MRARTNTFNMSNKRMLSWEEAIAYTGLGRNTCREWAGTVGAVKKIGRRVLFDRFVIDQALDQAKV